MKIYFATGNQNKIKEANIILQDLKNKNISIEQIKYHIQNFKGHWKKFQNLEQNMFMTS